MAITTSRGKYEGKDNTAQQFVEFVPSVHPDKSFGVNSNDVVVCKMGGKMKVFVVATELVETVNKRAASVNTIPL